MSIIYKCAGCQKQFKVADTSVGKRVKCKECGAVGTVTAQRAAAPAASPASAAARPPARRAAPTPLPPPPKLPPPPPPTPKPKPVEDDDPLAAMAELEQSGTVHEDGGYETLPPPPGDGEYSSAPAYTPPKARKSVAPVAAPWVPGFLSFMDFNKPLHRVGLIIGFGLLSAGGVVLALIMAHKAQEDSHFNAVAKEANGRLYGRPVRNDIRRRRGLNTEAYDVKYSFDVNGKNYRGERKKMEADDIEDAGGDPSQSFDQQNFTVPVFYDPDDPTNSKLFKPSATIDWAIAGGGGIIVLVGLYGAWRVFRYDRYARSIGS